MTLNLQTVHFNQKPSFKISDEEWSRFESWASNKDFSKDPIGAQFKFQFTPTSLGTIVSVHCGVTKEELVLTDFSQW